MYAIRKNIKSATPETKGELVAIYQTWIEASNNCEKGHYVCSYIEPTMPGTQRVKHPCG